MRKKLKLSLRLALPGSGALADAGQWAAAPGQGYKLNYELEALGLLREVLEKSQQPVQVVSSGNSMSPIIRKGDILTICHCSFKDIYPGDIAVFDAGNIACAHRLMAKSVKKGIKLLITKSDVCSAADDPVNEFQLLGKVTAIKKKQYLIKFDKLPWSFINYFLIGLHLCVFYLKKKLRPALISIGILS